ncbi:MAG: single-stranded-DNA-specific exonuclease RecJ [Helicobacteraceae bacterium]|nr:single-stranded-DNA-specific exonuclease RecJ [Helicobacteraceae bacterium]
MKIHSLEQLEAIFRRRFDGDTITKLGEIEPPNAFLDMQKATRKIIAAIEEGETIAIVGDYDADGVIASVILSDFFDCIRAKHSVYLPDRFTEGYGISPDIIDRIDANLIVTVDNGIVALKAAEHAKALGKTLIITDHHTCSASLPQAFAILNPKQPKCPSKYKEFCGAAIAWYLVASLTRAMNAHFDLNEALALVAIAAIADRVELKDANRALTKAGIKRLNASAKPYAIALRETIKAEIGCDDIAYKIAPKINAAGRITHSRHAYNFLKAASVPEAKKLLAELDALAKQRKTIEDGVFDEAVKQVGANGANAIIARGVGWHEGVIGIVAARLADRFKKPAIVISINGENAKASARVGGEADLAWLIEQCRDDVVSFGGHKKAAGINLLADRIDSFANAFDAICASYDTQKTEHSDVLGELDPSLISSELCDLIGRYEPFGEGNLKPVFVACDLLVKESRAIGENGAHLHLTLKCDRAANDLQAVWFFATRDVVIGDRVSFYYTVLADRFNGVLRVKLKVKEMIAPKQYET